MEMDALSQSIFPLASAVTREQQRNLCKLLWRWELCEECDADRDCQTAHCPWQQAPSLDAFFSYYRETTASYVPDLLSGSTPALRTHEDLMSMIRALKEGAQAKRHAFTRSYFTQRAAARGETTLPPPADQNRAVSLAARILAMVNSSAENQTDGLLESGTLPVTWPDTASFADFLQMAFPKIQGMDVDAQDSSRQQLVPSSNNAKWAKLTAKRLKRNAGLELMPTDNLQDHLRLDMKTNRVEIYHYTSVLKEHLLSSLEYEAHEDVSRGVSEGNIPRELALETLLSLKEILFPLDVDSQSLLRTLVSKKSFDPDCLRIDSRQYRRMDEKSISYRYWGSRLDSLYDQMENPTPSGYFERWMERRSGARYVMMATLGGVVIAVLLGALSLAVSIFQAWVGYQQWQHPVNPS